MNPLEAALLEQLGRERLQKIQSVKVGIAGLGGLGSNCAFNLVRVGFRRFTLVDFDRVEASNLNRQFYFCDQLGLTKVEALRENLLRINADLELSVYQERVTAGNLDQFFGDCRVVVEAFDRPEAKRMLVEHFWNSEKLVVSASGMAGWDDSDQLTTRQIKPRLFLVGDLVSEVSPQLPPLAPRVNIAAAKEANVVLKWVLEGCGYE